MFLVVLDIIHFKQLSKVVSPLTTSIDDKINSLLSIRMGHTIIEDNGLYGFTFPDSQDVDSANFGEFLWDIHVYLNNLEKDLYGYNLYITKISQRDLDRVRQDIDRTLIDIPDKNQIWVHDEALENFKLYFQIEPATPFSRVIKPTVTKQSILGQRDSYYLRPHLQESLKRPLEKAKHKLYDFDYILIHGDGGSGRVFNLKHALVEAYKCDIGTFSWIDCPMPNGEDFFALRHIVSSHILKKAAEYLSGTELSEWQSNPCYYNFLKGLEQKKYLHITSVDIFRSLYFYFIIYSRHLKVMNIPPLVIIQDFELIPDAIKQSLIDLMNLLCPRSIILPVFIAKKNKIKGLNTVLKNYSLYFEPIKKNELKDKEMILDQTPLAAQNAERLIEITGGRLMPVFHFLLLAKRGAWQDKQSIMSFSFQLLKEKELILSKVLYVIIASTGLVDEDDLIEIFDSIGFKEAYIRDKLKYLRMIGLIRETNPLFPAVPRMKDFLLEYLKEDIKDLDAILIHSIKDRYQSGKLIPSTWLYYFFEQHDEVELALSVLIALIDSYFICDNKRGLNYLLNRTTHFEKIPLDQKSKDKLKLVLFETKLRLALYYGNGTEANMIVKEEAPVFDRLITENPMLAAEYYLAMGMVEEGFKILKDSLYYQQEEGTDTLSVNYYLFGLALLKKGQLRDGLDYLDMALNSSTKSIHVSLLAKYYAGVGSFLIGKYDVAMKLITQGEQIAKEEGHRFLQCEFLFLIGRLNFELGDYQSSLKNFNLLGQICRIQGWNDFQKLSYIWKARCHTYIGNSEFAIQELSKLNSEESFFFLSEAFYMSGNYNGAHESLLEHINGDNTVLFLPISRINPVKGSRFLEDHLSGTTREGYVFDTKQNQMWMNLINAKRGYWDSAVESFKKLLSNEALTDHDLNNPQYVFFFYHILNQLGDQEKLDPITVLNKGYKILQERASENQDSRIKLSYLRNSYWNKRIMEEAKKNRLI
ncbi:hypothetical protein [Spirochaeta cellobiosiphila]|uniref:hypothetical protein n=1 Tax=Spirochaeta cellobiosiphila TaxID=504483 RepID=UPI0003FB0EEA|nr:hypothetical protein [Spirochaeta cellobiosiphila]